VRDKTTIQQAVASVSDGGHTRFARHHNRSRHRRYGRFRSCGGVLVPGFLTVQASCRGGLSVERPGVGGASWTATRRCWRTTRLSLQTKLEEYSVISDDHGKPACYYTQLHASNASLPEFLKHRSLEDAVSPMHSYTVQLLPLEKQGGGSPAEYRRRYQYPSEHKHMEDAVSPTLALTRAPSRRLRLVGQAGKLHQLPVPPLRHAGACSPVLFSIMGHP